MKQIYLNASGLTKAKCYQAWYYTCIDGYKKKEYDRAIEFGQALHTFAKSYYTKNRDIASSMIDARSYFFPRQGNETRNNKHLTAAYLTQACAILAEFINNDTFEPLICKDEPLIEKTFAFPLCTFKDIEFICCGTIDKIGKFKRGAYAIGDWKSTSGWNKDSFFDNFFLRPQFRVYLLGVLWYAEHFPESIFGDISATSLGVFIDAIFLSTTSLPEIKRGPMRVFKQHELEESKELMLQLCDRYATYLTNNSTVREGIMNGTCYDCIFRGACAAPDETSRNAVLNQYFTQETYDPIHRTDKTCISPQTVNQ